MGVLLKIRGNCSCLRAKVAHLVGHLPPPSGSYSMFGFDPQHTRYNSYEKILNSNNVSGLMKYPIVLTEGPIWSSPTVVNGIIYVGSDDKKLYAISVTTGQPLWTGSTRAPIWSSPAVVNGIVYVGSNDGNLYAFSASGCGQLSCPPLWTASTGDVIDSSPTVVNHVVYVGSRDGNLYAFSASGCGQLSCPPLWTASTGTGEEIVASSPAVTNDIVYVGSWSKPNGNGGKLYAFSATGCGKPSCPPLWTASLHGNTVSSPAVANGVVYIGSDNGLYTFSATGCGQSSCFPLWTAPIGGSASSPAVANGVVYISSGNGKLYAFSATGCGKPPCPPLWTAFIGGTTNESSPAVANGVVYIGSGSTIPASDKFYAFSATGCGKPSCSPLWTASIGNIESSSAVANGIVYIGSIDHTLYEFHLSGMKP